MDGEWHDHVTDHIPPGLDYRAMVHLDTDIGSGFGSFRACDVEWDNRRRQNKIKAFRIPPRA